MKITTFVLFLKDRKEANRLENTSYTSIQELLELMAVDGVEYLREPIEMTDFMDEWNDFMDEWNETNDDNIELKSEIDCIFITYVYITE